jgi:hypothetical protein
MAFTNEAPPGGRPPKMHRSGGIPLRESKGGWDIPYQRKFTAGKIIYKNVFFSIAMFVYWRVSQ